MAGAAEEAVDGVEKPRTAERAEEADVNSSSTGDGNEDHETAILQARLDAELASTNALLTEHERDMTNLVMNETRAVWDRIADLRRKAIVSLPDRLSDVLETGVDEGMAGVFIKTLREHVMLVTALGDPTTPTDEWTSHADMLAETQLERLVGVYTKLQKSVHDVVFSTLDEESDMIQESVARIRARARKAVTAFYDAMEAAEFQLTYHENEGWDKAMKRRGRFHREALQTKLKDMTIIGTQRNDNDTNVDLQEVADQLKADVNQLFQQVEPAFQELCARLREDPKLLLEKSRYSDILVEVHDRLTLLSGMVEGQEIRVITSLYEPMTAALEALAGVTVQANDPALLTPKDVAADNDTVVPPPSEDISEKDEPASSYEHTKDEPGLGETAAEGVIDETLRDQSEFALHSDPETATGAQSEEEAAAFPDVSSTATAFPDVHATATAFPDVQDAGIPMPEVSAEEHAEPGEAPTAPIDAPSSTASETQTPKETLASELSEPSNEAATADAATTQPPTSTGVTAEASPEPTSTMATAPSATFEAEEAPLLSTAQAVASGVMEAEPASAAPTATVTTSPYSSAAADEAADEPPSAEPIMTIATWPLEPEVAEPTNIVASETVTPSTSSMRPNMQRRPRMVRASSSVIPPSAHDEL